MVGRFSANLARGLTNKEIIMKRLLLILILVFAVMSASDARMSGVMLSGAGTASEAPPAACADTSCSGFLYCQNAEGTGYDNSETWTESGTVDEDATTAPLRGSQSITIADASKITMNITTDGELYAFGRFSSSDVTPDGTGTIFKTTNGGSDVGKVSILSGGSAGKLYCQNGTATGTATTALQADTTYYIWIHSKAATSAVADDGVITASVSATRNYADINADLGCSVTAGTDDDTDITSAVYSNASLGTGIVVKVDQLLGKTTSFGDVCE